MGNLAALRTFRVLRALKTVAVVPGKHSHIAAYDCNHCYDRLLKLYVRPDVHHRRRRRGDDGKDPSHCHKTAGLLTLTVSTARRKARFASVAYATAYASVCPSVRYTSVLSKRGNAERRGLHLRVAQCL